jgi:hypothetical protein
MALVRGWLWAKGRTRGRAPLKAQADGEAQPRLTSGGEAAAKGAHGSYKPVPTRNADFSCERRSRQLQTSADTKRGFQLRKTLTEVTNQCRHETQISAAKDAHGSYKPVPTRNADFSRERRSRKLQTSADTKRRSQLRKRFRSQRLCRLMCGEGYASPTPAGKMLGLCPSFGLAPDLIQREAPQAAATRVLSHRAIVFAGH